MVKICGLTRVEDVVLAWGLGAWAVGFIFAPSLRRLTPARARGLIDEATQAVRATTVARSRTGGTAEGESVGAATPPAAVMPPAVEGPLAVGVFGNVSAGEIARVVELVGLDAVQLHGDSGPGAGSVREALTGWESPLRLAGRSAGLGRSGPWSGRPDRISGPGPGSRDVLIIQAVPVAAEGCDSVALREKVEQARRDADLVLLDTSKSGLFGGSGATFTWELARESAADAPLLVAGGIGVDNVRVALERSAAWGVDVSSGVETAPGIKDARLMEGLFVEVAGVPRPAPREHGEGGRRKGSTR